MSEWNAVTFYTLIYLYRAVQIGSFEAKVDLAGYGHSDEQPVVKTKVVDQLENIWYRQVNKRHGTLEKEVKTHKNITFSKNKQKNL